MKKYSILEINEVLNGIIIGDKTLQLESPEQLERATANQISFIGHKKYEKFWLTSNARAAIVNEDISIQPGHGRAFIKVRNADLAMSQVLALFAPAPPQFEHEIHPNATIHPSAKIGLGCKIGSGCYVGPNAKIGANVTLYANVGIR